LTWRAFGLAWSSTWKVDETFLASYIGIDNVALKAAISKGAAPLLVGLRQYMANKRDLPLRSENVNSSAQNQCSLLVGTSPTRQVVLKAVLKRALSMETIRINILSVIHRLCQPFYGAR
jgi:hypothetical protein